MIGKDKTRIMVTLSRSVLESLKTMGEDLERPVSCLVREAVREWIARHTLCPGQGEDEPEPITNGKEKQRSRKKKKRKK